MPKPAFQPRGKVHVHMIVSDMKASIDFYVTVLGFHYDHGVREMAWLTAKNLLLTISAGDPGDAPGPGYFGFLLDDVDELQRIYAALHARFQKLSAPPDPAEGRSWFFLYDPDNHPIGFSCHPLEFPFGGGKPLVWGKPKDKLS